MIQSEATRNIAGSVSRLPRASGKFSLRIIFPFLLNQVLKRADYPPHLRVWPVERHMCCANARARQGVSAP